MITVKSENEIAVMRQAGRITALALKAAGEAVRPGVTTYELDRIAHDVILSNNATPAFLNYNGFPASICASVNEEVVHGIPSKHKVLAEGDIVSIDVGAVYKGYVGDMARTFPVGKITAEAERLIEVTKESFFKGIEFATSHNRLYDISAAVQAYAEQYGFGVIRDYVGHGIGTKMHEDPSIPNYREPYMGRGVRLAKGMTLAIEPMITMGTYEVHVLPNNWTVVTNDNKYAAHYENTIAVTDGEAEILTLC